jgi:DNA mismatch repair ATPase MutL
MLVARSIPRAVRHHRPWTGLVSSSRRFLRSQKGRIHSWNPLKNLQEREEREERRRHENQEREDRQRKEEREDRQEEREEKKRQRQEDQEREDQEHKGLEKEKKRQRQEDQEREDRQRQERQEDQEREDRQRQEHKGLENAKRFALVFAACGAAAGFVGGVLLVCEHFFADELVYRNVLWLSGCKTVFSESTHCLLFTHLG